jgi:myo-inositol-1(or 4)-monophosphatase
MDYKKFAIDLAKEAGVIIKKNFILGMKKEWKSDGSPLTETDLVINQLVIDTVKKEFPTHSVLAEEGSDFSEESDYVWVCDPLDGTIPFSHGIPTCVFSLALTHHGESIVGVVYDPFMDRMFVAEKGKGAFMNEKKIYVSENRVLKSAIVGITYWKDASFDLSNFAEALKIERAHLLSIYSITYMGVLVASGELVATIYPGNKSYDTAAVKVIVEEAGGRVTDLFGDEQRYDRDSRGHLVSNSLLHEELLELIRSNVKTPHVSLSK